MDEANSIETTPFLHQAVMIARFIYKAFILINLGAKKAHLALAAVVIAQPHGVKGGSKKSSLQSAQQEISNDLRQQTCWTCMAACWSEGWSCDTDPALEGQWYSLL